MVLFQLLLLIIRLASAAPPLCNVAGIARGTELVSVEDTPLMALADGRHIVRRVEQYRRGDLITEVSTIVEKTGGEKIEAKMLDQNWESYLAQVRETVKFTTDNYGPRRGWPESFVPHLYADAERHALNSTYYDVYRLGSDGKKERVGTYRDISAPFYGVEKPGQTFLPMWRYTLPMENYLKVTLPYSPVRVGARDGGSRAAVFALGGEKIEPGNFCIKHGVEADVFREIFLHFTTEFRRPKFNEWHRLLNPHADPKFLADYVAKGKQRFTYGDSTSLRLYAYLGYRKMTEAEFALEFRVGPKVTLPIKKDGTEWWPMIQDDSTDDDRVARMRKWTPADVALLRDDMKRLLDQEWARIKSEN